MDSKRLPFTLYRVLAYLAGIWLLLLTFVALPAKYLIGSDARFSLVDAPAGAERWFGAESALMMPIAVPHGYIYMAYVLVVLWLAVGRRWSFGATIGTMIAGTVPFVGLVVEHRLARRERERERAAREDGTPVTESATSG